MIGKIHRVSIREVWPHEAYNLTTWLQENLDALSDAIGFSLSSAEREQPAGPFSVDLVAEDEMGRNVIIENQLEKSDHDHLGKLLTYLAVLEASVGIWIVAEPRAEHTSAVAWLNKSTAADFYLLKLEAIRINDSLPAPLFTLIVGPSEEVKEAGRTKQELSERHDIRRRFWMAHLERVKQVTSLHANLSPGSGGWIATTAGKNGLSYNYVVGRSETRVELYIDRGKNKDEENTAIYNQLLQHRESIEEKFGEPLEWQALENRRACRILKAIEGGYQNEEEWEQIQMSAIDAMVRFEQSLKPFIMQLQP